ncbi:MAG: STAS domain-containing protein, partial [Jannaschia helgolandensis]
MSEGRKTPKDIFDLVIDGPRLVLSGRLHIDALQGLDRARARNMARGVKVIDMARLTRIDTAGAWFLVDLQRSGATGDRTIALEGASEPQTQLLETVRRNLPPEDSATIKPSLLTDRLERIGRKVARGARIGAEMISFLGQTVGAMAAILVNPRRLRLTSLVHHCQEVGLNAVPIVALMA